MRPTTFSHSPRAGFPGSAIDEARHAVPPRQPAYYQSRRRKTLAMLAQKTIRGLLECSLCRRHGVRTLARAVDGPTRGGLPDDDDDTVVHDILQLPARFLRESDASNFDGSTFQRNNVTYDMASGKNMPQPEYGNHIVTSCRRTDNGAYQITWSDGKVTEYSKSWTKLQLARYRNGATDRIPWIGLTEEAVRAHHDMCVSFHDAIQVDSNHQNTGNQRVLRSLYQYGILLVTGTPIDDGGAGIAALASALGGGARKDEHTLLHHYQNSGDDAPIMLPHGTDGPLRTLYGTIWSTTSTGQAQGASTADSAYGHDGLPLHTDMTYHRDPPGLQIFTMVQPSSCGGGQSVFGDGLAAAERLRQCHPDAFATLSRTIRHYRSVDQRTGWNLQAHGPVISVLHGRIVGIRHNDLDRLPDLPPPPTEIHNVPAFYEKLDAAHRAWDDILGSDDIRLVMSLQPSDTVVVANQRCFHGRTGFAASVHRPRTVMGCYVSQDELNSRWRLEGYDVL